MFYHLLVIWNKKLTAGFCCVSFFYHLTLAPQLLALEEHVMCFNADILILGTANIASPIVEYIPKEMPSTVEIRLDSEG